MRNNIPKGLSVINRPDLYHFRDTEIIEKPFRKISKKIKSVGTFSNKASYQRFVTAILMARKK